MKLNIFLITGEKLQVSSFESFSVEYKGDNLKCDAVEIGMVNILDEANYHFIGDSAVVISGKNILCLEAK